jgi:hypothetical protein
MDCLTSEEMSVRLPNVAHNFASSKIFSIRVWPRVYVKESGMLEALKKYCMSPLWSNSFINCGSKQECKTAREFLMEPWVLIQLPWNTNLLHQWLVAVQAEILQLMPELARFMHWPFPMKHMFRISQMSNIICELSVRIEKAFQLVVWLESKWPESNSKAPLCILDHVVLPVLKLLEFILSKRALNLIRTLNSMVFSEQAPSDRLLISEFPDVAQFDCNDFYWKFQKKDVLPACKETDMDEIVYSLKNVEFLISMRDTEFKVMKSVSQDEIASLETVWEKQGDIVKEFTIDVLRKNIKSGVDLEVLIPWENQKFKLLMTKFCASIEKHQDVLKGVSDKCVSYNLLALNAELQISLVKTEAAYHLYLMLLKSGALKRKDLFLVYENPEVSEMECNKFDDTLEEVVATCFSRDDLRNLIPEDYRHSKLPVATAPVWDGHYNQTIQYFEVHIIQKKFFYTRMKYFVSSALIFLLFVHRSVLRCWCIQYLTEVSAELKTELFFLNGSSSSTLSRALSPGLEILSRPKLITRRWSYTSISCTIVFKNTRPTFANARLQLIILQNGL